MHNPEDASKIAQQELLNQQLVVEIWDPQLTQAEKEMVTSYSSIAVILKDSVRADLERMSELDLQEFGVRFGMDYSKAADYLVYTPNSVACVLRNQETQQIEAFTIALAARDAYAMAGYSDRSAEDTIAYIATTVVDPKMRGQKQVNRLMTALEEKLREKGYIYIDRDANDTKQAGGRSYADSIIAQAGDRMVHQEAVQTQLGPQRYIRMKL